MLVALETTVWSTPVPNHIYYLNKSRDRLFGYLPFGKTDPQWYPEPRSFNAKGRKFLVLEEQPDPVSEQPAESWQVQGSKGSVWTVMRENGEFSCDCPNSKFRGGVCKHIQQIRKSLQ